MAQDDVDARPQLRITRRYPVRREKVWRAWTDPQALSAWFGPGGPNSVTQADIDLREGGRYTIAFRTPDGAQHRVSGLYLVVQPPGRLVFSWSWQSTPERVSRVSLVLREVQEGCELEFLHEQFFDQVARDNHQRGWAATFDKLDAFLAVA